MDTGFRSMIGTRLYVYKYLDIRVGLVNQKAGFVSASFVVEIFLRTGTKSI